MNNLKEHKPQDQPCVVCLRSPSCGHWNVTIFGRQEQLPCCPECAGERITKWIHRAIEFMQRQTVAIQSSGNFLKDYSLFLGFVKHNSRIEDGVCPNGCALLEPLERGDKRNGRCSVCRFVLHANHDIMFVTE